MTAAERSLAIVMPSYNEGENLETALKQLQTISGIDEIIVVDASDDAVSQAVVERCKNLRPDWLLHICSQQKASRAAQMNAGADMANSKILLFLHADTRLPIGAINAVKSALKNEFQWGYFNVRLDGPERLLRFVEKMMNWRSCRTGIATGDQAIFVTRSAFNTVGGFPNYPLMEDVELSKRLKRVSKPVCIDETVTTSARRWQQSGIARTIVLMWCLRLAYFLGVSPKKLAYFYRQVR